MGARPIQGHLQTFLQGLQVAQVLGSVLDVYVQVAFPNQGIKKLAASIARLEKR